MTVEERHRDRDRNNEKDDWLEGENSRKGYVNLKRNVGLPAGISFIVGTIIGSGIFISPKGVLTETKSVGLSLIVWAGSGILVLLGSLCYCELGTLIPKSGGEYAYFSEALIPIIVYLFVWTRTIVIQPSSVAITSMVFASYFLSFFDHCGTPQQLEKIVAVICILTICIINCYDTKWAIGVQVFFTVTKLVAIIIIIIGGFVRLGQGQTSSLQNGFEGTSDSPSAIALAFYDALWAYDGWNTLNYLTEELKNPYKNLLRANILGILIATVVYVLINISYLVVLNADGVLNLEAVAVEWGKRMLGDAWIIMPLAVCFSAFGAANGRCFSFGRNGKFFQQDYQIALNFIRSKPVIILSACFAACLWWLVYAAARDGYLPEVLSFVHVKRLTPLPSIVFTCLIAILMVIPSDIGSLINFLSFASWVFYAVAGFCVILMRFTRRKAKRKIKVFILIPVIFVIISIYLVSGPIIDDPRIELLYAFLFIVGGLVFYFPLVVFKLDRGCFDHVTKFLQLLCEVGPSPYQPDSGLDSFEK